MLEKAITYKELKLSICPILYIKKVSIEEVINEHAIMKLSAVLADEMKEQVIHDIGEVINLYAEKNQKNISLFQGRITKIRLNIQGELYVLELEAKSYTYGMDITKRSRSFQNIQMMSHEVIQAIMKKYPKSDCQIQIPNEPIGELVIQYQETDWEFIKRFVSRYEQGIYVENSFSSLRYYVGIPGITQTVNWNSLPYTISKPLNEYSTLKHNKLPNLTLTDYVLYHVQAYEYLTLGSAISYKQITMYITKIKRFLEEGNLMSEYTLQTKKGLMQPRIFNKALNGISMDGRIVEVSRNKVKVQLEIDSVKETTALYWFPYSTVSASKDGSGWHCMPERGEQVRVYFPTKDEKDGYTITKIESHTTNTPTEGDTMSNPNIKNISTAQNNQVHFTPEGVLIMADSGNGMMRLNLDGSVDVVGIEDITLNAIESINLRAEKELTMSGNKKIDLLCEKDGKVEILPGGNMRLSAKEIYEN